MQGQSRGYRVCAALGCRNNQKNCKLSFFSFPKDIERARRWAIACGREDLLQKEKLYKGYRLCGAHFENHMFLNDLRNGLHQNVVPSIFPQLEGSSASQRQQPVSEELEKNSHPLTSMLQTAVSFAEGKRASEEILDVPSKIARVEVESTGLLPPLNIEVQQESSASEMVSPSSYSQTSPVLLSPRRTQTSNLLSANTPRKQKYKNIIKRQQREIAKLKMQIGELEQQRNIDNITVEDFKLVVNKFCPKELATFINVQVTETQKKAKGRRYSKDFKTFCLMMYFMGPKLYKKLLVNMFCLPGPRVLLKFIQHIDIKTGINSIVFDTLQKKVENFKEIDRHCVLCVDEMSIKADLFYNCSKDYIIGLEDFGGTRTFKPALNATVIMARGLTVNWKQALAYYFVNSTCPATKLKDFLFKIILKLREIGIVVCVLVTDMGPNNSQMAQILNICPECPYFFVEDQKIVYIFDTPHLVKATRNN